MRSARTPFFALSVAAKEISAAFPALYTEDAILIFHGAPPIVGPEAIKRFWESRISAGARDHTSEIIETWADG